MDQIRLHVEQEVASLLTSFSNADVGMFVRPELGSLSFDTARGALERLVRLCRRLSAVDISLVPDERLVSLRDTAKAVFSAFRDVLAFDPEKHRDHPFVTRDQLIQDIHDASTKAFDEFPHYVSLAEPTVDVIRDERIRLREASEEYRRAAQADRDEAALPSSR